MRIKRYFHFCKHVKIASLKSAMKPYYLLCIPFLLYTPSIKSQPVVIVSGQCINAPVTLDSIGVMDGKPVYEGTGTVDGNAGVLVDVYWMPAPDNLWVLAFDGQPYFQDSCDTPLPPASGGSCAWAHVTGQPCTGVPPLDITGTGTLSVKITSFTALKKDKEVVLNWQTASEINNKGFQIQRSANGIDWTNIGFVNGNFNSSVAKNYRFSDVYPLSGRNFYRLVQFDIDNKASYSFIVSVNMLQPGFYSISNNPGKGLYRLHIEAGTNRIDFSVIDAGGKQIMSKFNNSAGDQLIDISKFSSGIYFLRILKGTNSFTEKLVKF